MKENIWWTEHEHFDTPDPEPKRRGFSCRDRMCGALDCQTCRPGSYREDGPDCHVCGTELEFDADGDLFCPQCQEDEG